MTCLAHDHDAAACPVCHRQAREMARVATAIGQPVRDVAMNHGLRALRGNLPAQVRAALAVTALRRALLASAVTA